MRRLTRFLLGVAIGGGGLLAYLQWVGVGDVAARAGALAPWALAGVVLLVVAEGVVDGAGVWASVLPLGRGLSGRESVQYALAGDFFDVLSPAGPVTSEPIMAQFIGSATRTTYSEALGVRGVAKYVKSGAQLLVSTALAVVLLADGASPDSVLVTLGGGVVVLLVVGALLLRTRSRVSAVAVVVLAPFVRRVSALYREDPHDRETVAAAVDRFWVRVLAFEGRPRLLVVIALAGVAEQALTAAALWVALAGTGAPVALLPILVVVPLPQAASVVPVPASLGAYDALLSGALVLLTGASAAAAAAAVLVVRTVSVPFGVGAGGLAVAFLRGWRPA